MPHEEPETDPARWVASVESWLTEQLNEPLLVENTDQRLRAIAMTHFEIACMSLAKAIQKAKTR